MRQPTKAEQDALDAQKLKELQINAAYARLFGRENERTHDQQIVWEDMENRAYMWRTTLTDSQEKYNASAEGQRLFHLNTIARVKAGRSSQEEIAPKVSETIMNQS